MLLQGKVLLTSLSSAVEFVEAAELVRSLDVARTFQGSSDAPLFRLSDALDADFFNCNSLNKSINYNISIRMIFLIQKTYIIRNKNYNTK